MDLVWPSKKHMIVGGNVEEESGIKGNLDALCLTKRDATGQ